MYRKLTVLFLLSVLCGCSDNTKQTEIPDTPPVSDDKCADLPKCDGESRIFCSDNAPVKESCGDYQTCLNGNCVPNGKCGPDFAKYCQDDQAVSCVDSHLKYESCTLGCAGNVCATDTCSSDPRFPYCDEEGNRVICDHGNPKAEPCASEKTCVSGDCISVAPACGNGEPNDDESCDDGELNGQYGKCRADCSGISQCGDGIPDTPDEVCDDGEENGNYGKCREDCSAIRRCGDGIPDIPDEVCDDGEDNGKPEKCASDCQSRPGCGNGVLDPGEDCDPPSSGMLITCNPDCTAPQALFDEFPSSGILDTTVPDTCDPYNLWHKYLIYRERFIGNAAKHIPGFISWGTDPGQSLPAEYRDPTLNCATAWRYHHEGNDCAFEDLPDANGSYGFSDTSLWLGIMTHWLALEYATYKMYGLDTTETERYIYLALKAFDRLDLAAEPFFGVEGKLDGFFIRDDIPRTFFKNGENYRFIRTDGYAGYECAVSGNACAIHSGATAKQLLDGGTFVSQDQITGIYEGFGMIAKFLDDSVEYEGYKLRHGARSAIDRIIRNLRDNHWLIRVETPNGWLQVPEEWGGYTQMMSSLFAEGANAIAAPDFGLESYHDDGTNAMKNLIGDIITTLWPLWEHKNNYNRNLILRLLNYTEFWDDATFAKISMESGRELWALSHALYWNRPLTNDYPLWRMHTILSTAPCDGPCSGDNCRNPTTGWMGENYFISPNVRAGYAHSSGDYNGLDYLISYNLYALAYAQKTGRSYTQSIETATNSAHQLEDIINGSPAPQKYIIADNTKDMQMVFCGRSFADWIRDNALGIVDIYTNTSRWQCTMDGECTISSDSAPYTHRNAVIIGTNQADTIDVPSGHHHCISSLDGDDTITAAAGMHFVESGPGNDTIRTNGPHVTIYSGDGDDKIYPANGYHLIDAGMGNDLIDSGSSTGTHLIVGGPGNDTIRAGEGANSLVGGPGNDILEAKNGDNVVWGNDGDDKINLGNGDNIIFPGDGNAFILVGNGDNSIQTISPQDDNVYICFGSGKNSIYAGWSSTSLCSDKQNSDIHDNSCRPTLTADDCSQAAYNAWK